MFPATDTLLPMAQVLKSYGTEGEVLISFQPEVSEYFESEGPVFLSYDGLPVPFFILSSTPKGNNRAIVRLDGIDSMEEAEEIAGQRIYLPKEECGEENPGLESLIGFSVYDPNKKKIGIIRDIHDFSGNICFELEESEILIPYHDDLFVSLDEKTCSIVMKISEGLI